MIPKPRGSAPGSNEPESGQRMNPYEPPQTANDSALFLLPDGLSVDQQQVFRGYKACSMAGQKILLGIILLVAFFIGIYQIQRFQLFDVRYCYIAGLYPFYVLLVGWLLNRQGFSLLAQHASLPETRTNYLLCGYLSWAKLLTFVCCFFISVYSLDRFYFLGAACVWPVLELLTILLQFSIVRDKGNTPVLEISHRSGDYLGFGLSAILLFSLALIFQIALHTGAFLLSVDTARTITYLAFGIAFFIYAQQLMNYIAIHEHLARSYLRSEP
jgi:hypothetical protein